MRSNLELVVSDDANSRPDVLRATTEAMLLAKDSLTDLQLSAAMPSHLQNMLERTVNQLTIAEKHMLKIEGFVSKASHFKPSKSPSLALTKDTNAKRRILSSNRGPSPKYPGLARADYHNRAKGYAHPILGHHFGHHQQQQGYHGSRVSRQEGTHRRRMTDTNECVDVDLIERKEAQCIRLAECAEKYSLYDMFVFEFGDDIDFDTGKVDTDIKAYDEKQLRAKVSSKVFSFSRYVFYPSSQDKFTSYNVSKIQVSSSWISMM